eukprot:COSAG02_NODE_345_length_24135_cov_6.425404_1_plen_250_part_10
MRIIPATGWVGDNDPRSPAAKHERQELAGSPAPLGNVHAHEVDDHVRVSKPAPHGNAGCGDDGQPDNAAMSKPVLIFVCDTTGTRTVHLQDGARLAELYAAARGYNTGEVVLRFLGGALLPRDDQLTLAECPIRSNTYVEVVGRLLGGVEVTIFGRQHTIDGAGGLNFRTHIGPAEIKEVAAFIMTPAGAALNSIVLDENLLTGTQRQGYGYARTICDVQIDGFKALCDALAPSQIREISLQSCWLGPQA